MAHEGIRPGGLHLTERAVEFCGFASQSRVLDVGSGNGATVGYLQAVHDLQAVGLDASALLAGEARRRRPLAPLVIGTAGRLPFCDHAFDGLFLECTLSLTSDSLSILTECHRVIREGGAIIITDVNVRNPDVLAGLRKLPRTSCLQGAEAPSAVQGNVRAAGFEIELWEDHSDLLKDFAIRMIWTMGSMRAFWGFAGDGIVESDAFEEAVRHSRPGYHLLVGRK